VGARAAGPAQRILWRCAIHPNAKVNGIWLPATSELINRSNRAPHPGLHTNHYYRNINMMVSTAYRNGGCAGVLDVLDLARFLLKKGIMPH